MKQTQLLVIGVCAFLGACSPNETGSATDASSAQLTEIQVNGITLNYNERGQGDTVLLVHGTLGDYRTWDGQIEAFPETIVSSPTAADITIPMSGHRQHPAFPRSSMPKIWRRSFSV